jgi:uncharacterized protein YbjT (DUF2867 family)
MYQLSGEEPIGGIALLVGATGLVGEHCLRLLLAEPRYKSVTALVRTPLKISDCKLAQHLVDFDRLDEAHELARADDVYCCLGTTIKKAGSQEAFRRVDRDYPVEVASLALERGATQFLLVSAIGANAGSSVFYNRVKGEVERDISALGYQGVQIFRPSLLLGERKEFRLGETISQVVSSAVPFIFAGPLRKYKPIPASQVAAAMVEVAKRKLKGINVFESSELSALASKSTQD